MTEVETLVSLMEKRTEARIELMNLVQGASLLFTVLIILLMLYDLRSNVVGPLKQLLLVAQGVARRDFSQRCNLRGEDELSRLGQALDQMTEELAVSYQGLENRVAEKTRELARSHSALELLHNANRSLYATDDLCEGAIPLLQTLEELLGIGPIRLYLHDRNSPEPVEAVTTAARERPYYCRDHDCNACLVTPQAMDELPWESTDGRRLLLPIRTATQSTGHAGGVVSQGDDVAGYLPAAAGNPERPAGHGHLPAAPDHRAAATDPGRGAGGDCPGTA